MSEIESASPSDTLRAAPGAPPGSRTVELPMAFSGDEFFAGAWTACAIFFLTASTVLLATAQLRSDGSVGALLGGHLLAAFVLALVTVVAAVIGTPITWLIGRVLRRQRRRGVHLLVLAAWGAGYVLLWAFAGALILDSANQPHDLGRMLGVTMPIGALLAPVGAASVAVGWYRAMRRAVSADRAREQRDAAPGG